MNFHSFYFQWPRPLSIPLGLMALQAALSLWVHYRHSQTPLKELLRKLATVNSLLFLWTYKYSTVTWKLFLKDSEAKFSSHISGNHILLFPQLSPSSISTSFIQIPQYHVFMSPLYPVKIMILDVKCINPH